MITYGNLALQDNGRWHISGLQPHVAIAFKRLFTKVPKTARDITLMDTDEIRADLHWFMQRYPLQHANTADLQAGVHRVTTKAAERERILMPDWKPAKASGFVEGRQPYGYQQQAAALTIQNPNLLLGDDLGLGKTISALCALTCGAPMPAAIVVQTHLAQQWADRAEEFTHLRTHIIKGTSPYDLPMADVYIFKYSNIAGWTDLITTGLFRTVIYDEVQELRTGRGTAKGAAAHLMSSVADVSMGLTATPIYNYGDEIFNVLQFIEPGLLGDRDEFMREWCNWGKTVKEPDALGSYLRDKGYFLRRTEHDETVSAQIPPLNTVDWEVAWNDGAAQDAEDLFKTLALTVLEGSFTQAGQAARELDMKMRLLTGVAKAESVAAYVDLLLQDAPRVLLAGWHRDVYDIWTRALLRHNPVMYTGTESPAGKRRSVARFTTGDSRVMMISLRSGAGLDGLQEYCSDVVFGELDWSPQVHKQVIGRLRRPGQTRQVTAHYLHTAGGSDPVIMDMLGVKADQSRGIIDPMKGFDAKQMDDGRMKKLAKAVLGRETD
ncbi:DEAD/DEAH box helicase [Leisingera sp. HS039]|uniref:SNF2-related protein n=1 Tax=Leisingera sp. HS039 TaxID=2818496 RepID=UPI001B39D329|nr:DEAD/DEAH box helicase [Leisingera sp. HS039]MBQ4826595.1 DEAD/DEAH box helicase [Leisingera sp. HS039]